MMLVTRPNFDPATRYLKYWSEEVIKEARRKGFEVVDLTDEKATQSEFEGRLRKTHTLLVLLNGHGSSETVTGQDHEILVQANDNAEILKGKITYAVSCDSARVLGRKVALFPKTTYIGYDDEFVFFLFSKISESST